MNAPLLAVAATTPHHALYSAPPLPRRARRVDLVLIGARGQVGSALRRQLAREQPALPGRAGVDLRLIAAFDRRGFAADVAGLDPLALDGRLVTRTAGDWSALVDHLADSPHPSLVIDATASDTIADDYARLLAAGIGVVTPNKRANTRSLAQWQQLADYTASGSVPYRYETTVGAALPVLSTLKTLRLRGERVTAIEGLLSGSLSYVLGRLHEGVRFSAAVAEARARGYTEPDPRDDLGALDVARKLVILAREAGVALEPEAVSVRPLVGADWNPDAPDAATDRHWAAEAETARRGERRLVVLARWDERGARVGVDAVPVSSPFARIRPGENLVRIHTEYHADPPISVAGPGAGPEVTAAGLLGDVVDAASELARRQPAGFL